MIEHKKAGTFKDVGKFYDSKYAQSGYGAFSNADRKAYIDLLERFGGLFSPDRCLLDAGCGHGEFLECCKEISRYGVDASTVAVHLAQNRFHGRASIIHCDMETLYDVFGNKPFFDYIACLGAIEHTMRPLQSFNSMFDILKPGGVLLILVPLEFEDCLYQLRQEPNQNTNERFASAEEWIKYFVRQPHFHCQIGQDIALIYKKTTEDS